MPVDVTMPKLTDSMEEGRIVAWQVAVGDTVAEGDVLAEIETDKAVMELESFWDGTVVKVLHGDGDVVSVGQLIARIGPTGAMADEGGQMTGATAAPPLARVETPQPEAPQPDAPQPEELQPEELQPEELQPEELQSKEAQPEEAEVREPEGAKLEGEGSLAPRDGGGIPIPGGHPLSERGGAASPRPAPPARAVVPPAPKGAAPTAGVRAAPRARKRALELDIDLATVQPTGGDGQVTIEDVEAAAKGAGATSQRETIATPASVPPDRADEELPPVLFSPEEAEVEEVSFYQKAVIRRVVASKHVIPHFYVTKAVHADALLALREAAKEATGATLTHYLMRACSLSLAAHPEANRSYDRGRWIRWKVVHLGLAVQTDAGLVVAVLRGAQQRSLAWVVERTRALVDRARAGKLTGPERSNPTFTISNLGAYDVESFAAIINPPSALTLAVGSVVDVPVVEGGRVVPGKVLHLTLSCDHRVVDGVLAAQFLGEVKRLLENPGEL